ncbi:MAG: glycosyltransferase, partial [Desulfobacterales bacterium]|nr:glycosyltransferase [Desulfobacterales bacterium]
MASPKVTVLMSVYNGEKYLREAIDSILNQTFEDYEFLIIDDGSTDGTAAILGSYHDLRMKVVRNEENMGLTKSLNKGLTIAKGGYIARMDADDISLPERLQKQVEYLEVHPEIGVVGTWADYTDEHGVSRGAWRFPTEPALVGWWIILGGFCLAHPSVMMRFDVIKRLGFYDPEAIYAQDCELWTRANSVTRLANIPEVLLRYRYQEKSIRARHSQEQWQAVVNSMRPVIMRLIGSDVP